VRSLAERASPPLESGGQVGAGVGVGEFSTIGDLTPEKYAAMFDANVLGTMPSTNS
jgi:hypothetical protein